MPNKTLFLKPALSEVARERERGDSGEPAASDAEKYRGAGRKFSAASITVIAVAYARLHARDVWSDAWH
jgi:hypothetical protein